MLDVSCEFAIDLTVRDEEEVGEQSTLVQGCTTAVQALLSRVGMNARGTVKRVLKERPSALVKDKESSKEKRASASRKRLRRESVRNKLGEVAEGEEQPKRAAVSVGVAYDDEMMMRT